MPTPITWPLLPRPTPLVVIANILVNGVPQPKINGAIGDLITLTNSDNTDITFWIWEFLDRPAGSTAILTTTNLPSSTFVIDKEGTYLVKLTVNDGVSDTAAIAVHTALTNFRYPAAFEQIEMNPARGWAADLNAAVRSLEINARVGPVITAIASGSITAGYPVRIAGTSTLPDGTAVPTVSHANAATSATLPAMGVALNSVAGGNKLSVRVGGYCSEVAMNTAAVSVGSPIYVADGGGISTVAGTVEYVVGYVLVSNVSGVIYVSPGINRSAGVVMPSYWTAVVNDIYANNSGNVGIGTTTPNFKFDIGGDIRIRSANKLYFGGTGAADNDVNLYRSAADVLKTDDAFVSPVSITTPVVIGGALTTSPLTLKATTGVGTTGSDIIFQVGNNGATEALRFKNDGKVGIGTNAPAAKLEIHGEGTGSAALLLKDQGSTVVTYIELVNANSGGTGYNAIAGTQSRGTLIAPAAVASADFLFSLQGSGYDGTGYVTKAAIDFVVDGAVGTGVIPTAISFKTSNTSGVRTDRMRIASDGKVGIGTNAPGLSLDVQEANTTNYNPAAANWGGFRIKNYHGSGGSSQYSSMILQVSADNNLNNAYAIIAAVQEGAGSAGTSTTFMSRKTDYSFKEHMRLTSTGQLGIGTTTPGYALHANGNASTTVAVSSYGTGVSSGLLMRSGRGTEASPSATQSGDVLGYFSAQGHYGGVGQFTTGAKIDFIAEETWGTYLGTYMRFSTIAVGTQVLTEKMRLNGTGYLGIGTTSPNFPLDVNGDIRIEEAHKLFFGGTGAADNDVNLYRSAADVLKTDDAFVSDHLNLTTPEYDDMQVSLLASGVSSLNTPVLTRIMDITGYGTNKGVFAWGFAANREDDLVFSAQLPHSYKEGTDIEFHVHWTMNSASTGTVRWGLEYCWANADEYLYSTNYGASTTRERSGTTARITFNNYHGMVVGQGISVVDADVAAYNGDYVVTAMNDTNPYWIEYTIASGTEAPTADTDIRVTGFTTKIEATHTLSVASQQRHLITSIGTIKGTRTISNMAVSSILVCRFYRPELAGHIAERIPAMSVDFHHQKDTIGSRSLYTKV